MTEMTVPQSGQVCLSEIVFSRGMRLEFVWEQDVSEEGFPVPCLPIGTSPLRTTVTASEDSEAAETSRGAFSVLSRQEFPLKRKLSDAMGIPPLPDSSRCKNPASYDCEPCCPCAYA